VEAGGADAYFGPQSQAAAVVEPGRGIDHDAAGLHRSLG
jgi:hypothetical protein